MHINNISLTNYGYVHCESRFYSVWDIIEENRVFNFTTGVNQLCGDIDSGLWAISYLLSMYNPSSDNFILMKNADVCVDGEAIPISEILHYSCYMDISYHMFSTAKPINTIIEDMINNNSNSCSLYEIKDLFELDSERFTRPLSSVGNEIFRAMAAIAFAANKEIYCFPWLSKRRYDYYYSQLTWLFDILKNLNKIIILPIGNG